jgi:SAM-dependent methyltransferase
MTLVQRLMRTNLIPQIYETVWRPVLVELLKGGPLGPSLAEEYALARRSMALAPGDTVLDVACGPGNVTRALADGVGPGGHVVGVDASATMLAQAVAETRYPSVAYVRGDALRLPFATSVFDAVGCFVAFHLFADPWLGLAEMTRVLRPGGRIAIHTTFAALPGLDAVGRPVGVRVFGRDDLTNALTDLGYTGIRRRTHGFMQFAAATR